MRLRRAPERVLHRWRRRRTCAALSRRSPPAKLLVVCHGNICRSPFAAALLARALPGTRVESAGFIGPGRPAPRAAVVAAARYGVDLSAHRSQLLIAEQARAADLIVVMDSAQRRTIRDRFGRADGDLLILGDPDPQPISARAIQDP